jgi:hypothetical protein
MHHLPERSRGVGQGLLARRRARQGQKVVEALAGDRPRPRATHPLIRALLPVDGRLTEQPTRVGPRQERIVEVIERAKRRKVLARGPDPDPSTDRLSANDERRPAFDTVLAP